MYGIRRSAPNPEWWFAIPNEGVTFINIIPDGGFSSTGPTGNATAPSGQFNTGQYAIVSGQGRATNGAAAQSYIWFDIPTVAGRTYDMSIDLVAGTSGASCQYFFKQSDDSNVQTGTGAGTKSGTFVATGSFMRFTISPGTTTSGHNCFFDNMSLKLNNTATRDRIFAYAKDLGITGIRMEFQGEWNFYGSSAARYWTEPDDIAARCIANGLKLCFCETSTATWAAATTKTLPTSTSLTQWCTAFTEAAARYRGVCSSWEIRNEMNLSGFSADVAAGDNAATAAAKYMAYATAMAAAIRSGNPDAKIVSQGMSPVPTGSTSLGNHIAASEYLSAMYANGARGVFDAIGFHPYSRPEQPDAGTSYNGWTIMEREVRAIMGGAGEGYKPIWATEYGFPTGGTSAGEQTSEANTGEGIRRAAHMARALGNLPVISYHTAYDYLGSESGGASNELYYGIGAVGLTDKLEPAAAMRYATRMLP